MRGDDTPFPARLTVPRWPSGVPDLPRALAWTFVRAGCAGSARCAIGRWRTQEPAGVVEAGDLPAGFFEGRLVGWRLAVCGEAGRVARVVAAATAAGLLDEEIVVNVESTASARWFCPACGATTTVPAGAGSAGCDGCGRRLQPREHWSPASGQFLCDAS
ncbi:dimethylamine monooxygenase subunit DmmA family protein [Actinoplanes sp. M2I2]|uniref:dimethylamine monooxygenase subunit DmmA family protein n=1 Tax=Actinoplanes sp. M2I2 TaxID=1734444 RepID=UPI00202197E6|nr:dimethylamine monooxygenase subunit DmmA family protein [Actinoplanes sp. M2I2]